MKYQIDDIVSRKDGKPFYMNIYIARVHTIYRRNVDVKVGEFHYKTFNNEDIILIDRRENEINLVSFEKIESDIFRYGNLFVTFDGSNKPMGVHLNLEDAKYEIDSYYDWLSDQL